MFPILIHSAVIAVCPFIERYEFICSFEDPTNCTPKSSRYIDKRPQSMVLSHDIPNDWRDVFSGLLRSQVSFSH